MTGQELVVSYEDSGLAVAVGLVNELTLERAFGRAVPRADPLPAIREVLAIDPPSAARLRARDVAGFVALARRLREVFRSIDHGAVDLAASQLNELLAAHSAHPRLAKDDGSWRLHHHPADAGLVPMATAICAEAMARMVGTGAASRLGTCVSDDCERVFLDVSKNGSRRFCSTTCQNRVKAAAHRRRRGRSAGHAVGD